MGWNGSDRVNNSPKKETPKSTRKLRVLPYAICALGALFCAIALYFFLSKPASAPVARTSAPKTRTPAPKASTNLVKKTEKPLAAPKKEKPPFVKKPGTMQTPDGRVLTFPVPAPGEFRTVHSHGAVYKCDHEGNWVDITPKPVFDNAFEENLIGMNLQNGSFILGAGAGHSHENLVDIVFSGTFQNLKSAAYDGNALDISAPLILVVVDDTTNAIVTLIRVM